MVCILLEIESVMSSFIDESVRRRPSVASGTFVSGRLRHDDARLSAGHSSIWSDAGKPVIGSHSAWAPNASVQIESSSSATFVSKTDAATLSEANRSQPPRHHIIETERRNAEMMTELTEQSRRERVVRDPFSSGPAGYH